MAEGVTMGRLGNPGDPYSSLKCLLHTAGVLLVVEQDLAPDPENVGLLRRTGVVPQTERLAYLVEELFGRLLRRFHSWLVPVESV